MPKVSGVYVFTLSRHDALRADFGFRYEMPDGMTLDHPTQFDSRLLVTVGTDEPGYGLALHAPHGSTEHVAPGVSGDWSALRPT